MMTEIKLADAVGKKFKGMVHSSYFTSQALLVFEDGTFSTIDIEFGHDSGEGDIVESEVDLLNFGDSSLIEAGVATKEELEHIRYQKRQRWLQEEQARKEAYDRQEYERLKQKFGE